MCAFGCYVFGSVSREACRGKRRRGGTRTKGDLILAGWSSEALRASGRSFKMHGLGGRRPSEMSLAVMGGKVPEP